MENIFSLGNDNGSFAVYKSKLQKQKLCQQQKKATK